MDSLNPEQKIAVLHTEGPLMIIAGPGTGKTKTLTERINYLVASGKARPDEILALTFTKKAAAEMQQRIGAASGVRVRTFHGLCYELLRSQRGRDITFISDAQRTSLIAPLAKSTKRDTRELGLQLSRAKNLPAGEEPTPDIKPLLNRYNQLLHSGGWHDFDDLLRHVHVLLAGRDAPPVKYRYIMIDEFQDTNLLQYQLLLQIRNNKNICVIGDPRQSIYGFRGADGDIFARFAADFTRACTVTLTANYRSCAPVVALANALFPATAPLIPMQLGAGEVTAVEVRNEYGEAAYITAEMERRLGGTDFLRRHQVGSDAGQSVFGDFAVLYRTHHVARTLKRQLLDAGIPVQIAGDGSPYDKPQLFALLVLARYACAPSEEFCAAAAELPLLQKLTHAKRAALLQLVASWGQVSFGKLVTDIATKLGFADDARLIPDIQQCTGTLVRYGVGGRSAAAGHITELLAQDFYDPAADAVTLMSIHAAKGLEARHVFVLATEQGTMPHARGGVVQDIDEERRLFYVACTRARETLYLLYARQRAGQAACPSQFLRELPAGIVAYRQEETMPAQQRRYEKRAQKKRQTTLFDMAA